MSGLISAAGLGRDYPQPDRTVVALHEVSLEVAEGEFVVVTGESGSGKTTLLSLFGALDRPTRGSLHVAGVELSSASDGQLARLRRERLGFVFQDFLLVRHLSALENVSLPLIEGGGDIDVARGLLQRVGLTARSAHRPAELSRGEMQRVALARALIRRPAILFADEPTANLDRRNAVAIWELLAELHQRDGLTVVVATHEPALRAPGGRVVGLKDGRVVSDEST